MDKEDTEIKYVENMEAFAQQKGYRNLSNRISALDYIRRAKQFITELESDEISFKWAAIALHGAIYSYAACKAASIHSHASIVRVRKNHTLHLDDINTLLEKCGIEREEAPYSEAFGAVLCVVKIIRNPLQHPIPSGGMVIKRDFYIECFIGALNLIWHLIETCNWFNAAAYDNYKAEAKQLIESSKAMLISYHRGDLPFPQTHKL